MSVSHRFNPVQLHHVNTSGYVERHGRFSVMYRKPVSSDGAGILPEGSKEAAAP